MKHVCLVCGFVLAFCACTKAQSDEVKSAMRECAAEVLEAYAGADAGPAEPEVLAADLARCLPKKIKALPPQYGDKVL